MNGYSELYPITNAHRTCLSLDGLWSFQFDPQGTGTSEGWGNALPGGVSMPVPGSFAELVTDRESRDYTGDFWYERDFTVPVSLGEGEVFLRFGSITHRAWIFVNGKEVCFHEGGFLPVLVKVTEVLRPGEKNHLCVKVNNELNEESLPCGIVKEGMGGRKLAKPYFDFFNYSGIQRSVKLLFLPKEAIEDYEVRFALEGEDARVFYKVVTNGENEVRVRLRDAGGNVCAESQGKEGELFVKKARLWKVLDAYLYTLEMEIVRDGLVLDSYEDRIGIRTVAVEGTRILINGEPVYLRGFGKHEDFDVLGRVPNLALVKRDFACMKWAGANCFRTSHYPYDEEWYRMADEEGFLIIDEVPAVGMMRSTHNFVAAGTGVYTYFFEGPTVPALKANHIQTLQEMMKRDKNHPSVFAWSLFNEPETTSEVSKAYFTDIFAAAKLCDPQNRPLTGAFEKNSKPELCQVYPLCDFLCLNRYYGWYISGGELDEAEMLFRDEMDRWKAKELNKPFVFTEFGTDTLSTEHKLPSCMWSQEYQDEYLRMNFTVFDSYDFIQGELVWAFADFATGEGIFRVNGNKKGVFTRNRQPKDAAFVLKERWEKMA